MKNTRTNKKNLNSRLAIKAGSVLFLAFFIFFSLAAPLVAQIGSVLFILGGCALAPLLCSDVNSADNQLPAEPESAIYAPAIPTAATTSSVKKGKILPQTAAACCGQIKNLFLPLRSAPSGQNAATFFYIYISVLNTPVRAGPAGK